MRLARAALLCLTISACTPVIAPNARNGQATPDRALVYPVGLTLLMSDGTLCVGHRPTRAQDWTGQLSGCPHPLPYQVQGSDPTIPRLELRRGGAGTAPLVTVAGQIFSAP